GLPSQRRTAPPSRRALSWRRLCRRRTCRSDSSAWRAPPRCPQRDTAALPCTRDGRSLWVAPPALARRRVGSQSVTLRDRLLRLAEEYLPRRELGLPGLGLGQVLPLDDAGDPVLPEHLARGHGGRHHGRRGPAVEPVVLVVGDGARGAARAGRINGGLLAAGGRGRGRRRLALGCAHRGVLRGGWMASSSTTVPPVGTSLSPTTAPGVRPSSTWPCGAAGGPNKITVSFAPGGL